MRYEIPFSPQPKPKHVLAESAKNRKAKQFRDAVWARDKQGGTKGNEWGECARCHRYVERGDGHAEVDHIKPRSTHPELAYVPENGRLTCKACNRWFKTHPKERE